MYDGRRESQCSKITDATSGSWDFGISGGGRNLSPLQTFQASNPIRCNENTTHT